MAKKRKIGLALSGGAARGFAHIGVLKVLEEERMPVSFLAGTSAGALMGAFYASGMNIRMLERLTKAVERRTWIDFTVSRMGFIGGNKVEQIVYLLTRRATFSDLKIPFAAVAVDLYSGEKVVIKEGIVAEAVRASISIPGCFVPVEINGKMLVDGAVLERLPVEVVRNMGADFVIAVDTGFHKGAVDITNALDVITRSIEIMAKEMSLNQLDCADAVITPELGDIAPSQFERVSEAVSLGEKAARSALPAIYSQLEGSL